MTKKTIIYKIRVFPTVSETFIILNIVEALKAGFQVKIIPDIVDNSIKASQPHLIQQYNLTDALYVMPYPKRRITRYGLAFLYLCNLKLLFYFIKYCLLKKTVSLQHLFTLKFYSQFKKDSIFHIHFANREKPLFELMSIGFLKSKVIITAHGFDIHKLSKEKALEINKWVSTITVNTNYLKDRCISKGIDASLIQVVPVGIDTSLFALDTKTSSVKKSVNTLLSLISVGRFIPIKGHLYAIEAVKLLVDKGYALTYTIIGEGKEEAQLEKMIIENGLQDVVFLKPFQEQKELKKQLQAADVFLFPSTADSTGRCETFGVVSLEAQAMGLPVIGFKSGGFPETIIEGQTGFAVTDKNIVDMASAIEILIHDKELMQTMGQDAIVNVKHNFSAQKTTKQYIALYNA